MRTSGFTLIELMIALSIFAFLVFLAGPMYADFMGNSKIRNAAENTLTGVRLAQSNAIHSNRPARFVIDPSAGGGWAVFPFNDEANDYAVTAVDSYRWTEGATGTTVTPSPSGAVAVTFDGLGRVVLNGYPQVPDGTASLTRVDVTNPSVTTPRWLSILISPAGGTTATKLCDPQVFAPDPRSCS